MTDISEVIGWKFNHQPGMRTEDGVVTEFPGGIPSQAELDAWTVEYEARDVNEERFKKAFEPDDIVPTHKDYVRAIFEGFFEVANRLQALEKKQPITRTQLKNWFKSKLP